MTILLPEWAPNIHPMIVHFPIAILFLAVFVHALSVLLKQVRWLYSSAVLTYGLGAVSIVVTFITGRQAADSASLPPLANPVLSEHADLALWTVWYFVLFAAVLVGLIWKNISIPRTMSWISVALGAGGLGLLTITADHGAHLVYRFGVGVQTAEVAPSIGREQKPRGMDQALVIADNGSWSWTPLPGTDIASQFMWLEGQRSRLNPTGVTAGDDQEGWTVTFDGSPVLLVAGPSLPSIQADLILNRDGFSGSVILVHHVQDSLNYDFLSLDGGFLKLGRMEQGTPNVLHEKAVAAEGWLTMRVVGDGRHFRGYLQDELITHGHIDELPAGPAGLRFEGKGTISIKSMQVLSLKSDAMDH